MEAKFVILTLAGLFSIAGGAFNWNWFMENRKASFFTRILGTRFRARMFYIILGLVLLAFTLMSALGLVEL
jgi:drug/metabolite transporter superfamily protein YnfA